MNEKHLLRFVTFAPLIFIPTIIFAIFFINISYSEEIFLNSSSNLKEELLSKQKSSTLSRIAMAIELINHQRSTIEQRLKQKLEDRTEKAYAIGSHIYEQNRAKKSDAEIKKMITDALRTMIWNDGESFIFILDKEGVFALAPHYLKHLEGKSIIDFQDLNKRYVIQEEIKIVNEQGEGFLWDTFTRAGRDPSLQFKQMAFVKDFGHFNWYLGTAEYLDITTKEIEESMLSMLRNINRNSNEYFFIFDTDGNIIMHSQKPEFEGKNLLYLDYVNYRNVIERIAKSVLEEKNEFVSYEWENQISGEIESKLSFVKKIPNSNWIIGSGFYTKEIDEIISQKRAELQKMQELDLKTKKLYSIFFVTISIFISIFISKRLESDFENLKKRLAQKSDELEMLNTALEEKVEQRTHELKEAYERMHFIANTDHLTQIHNRYSFLQAFNDELEKYKISKIEFSLIMLDIDHFKDINDTFGHDIGDRAIIAMTQVAKNCLRSSDIFGRVGGEEFMVLLPYTSVEAAADIAQRIREAVDKHNFEFIPLMSVSLGVVEYKNNESGTQTLKRVDTALYEAKTQGRNRVVVIQ